MSGRCFERDFICCANCVAFFTLDLFIKHDNRAGVAELVLEDICVREGYLKGGLKKKIILEFSIELAGCFLDDLVSH